MVYSYKDVGFGMRVGRIESRAEFPNAPVFQEKGRLVICRGFPFHMMGGLDQPKQLA
jgi:hypothetical protein